MTDYRESSSSSSSSSASPIPLDEITEEFLARRIASAIAVGRIKRVWLWYDPRTWFRPAFRCR